MNRWIAFKYWPASWGLVGAAYDEAEAHYNLSGEPLERRLIEIRFADDINGRIRKNLDLDYKYHKIDDYEYDTATTQLDFIDPEVCRLHQLDVEVNYGRMSAYDADIIKAKTQHEEGAERDLALLAIDHEHGKINKNAYEKQQATLKNEPWVAFIDSGFDIEQGIDGVYFELDWNQQWVDFLKLHGFTGKTDEQIVDDWFSEVCRSYSQTGSTNLTTNLSAYPMGYSREE